MSLTQLPEESIRSAREASPRRGARLWFYRAAAVLLTFVRSGEEPAWPGLAASGNETATLAAFSIGPARAHETSIAEAPSSRTSDEAAIRAQPVCIAASSWSSGSLGEVVLFVHKRRGDDLRVGYFVYWSAERPWGDNVLTYSLFPALAIDAAYSHFLFVFPGLREALYGSGDVEGAFVNYDASRPGGLSARWGVADDASHREVILSRADLATRDGRVVLLTDVWSHQLGSHGAADYASEPDAQIRCFEGAALQPLGADVARRFRLGSAESPLRARPAWNATAQPS